MLPLLDTWGDISNWLSTTLPLAEWLVAFGTIGAVLVALGFFQGRPRLSIALQRLPSEAQAYWHQRRQIEPVDFTVRQLRIWLSNDGRKEAKNCRVKLRIIQPHLKGNDAPIEFSLPVSQIYKGKYGSIVTDSATERMLSPPEANELSITIAPHSKEAFELLYHFEGSQLCFPYTPTSVPMYQGHEYHLQLTAYAEDQKPTKPVTYQVQVGGRREQLAFSDQLESDGPDKYSIILARILSENSTPHL